MKLTTTLFARLTRPSLAPPPPAPAPALAIVCCHRQQQFRGRCVLLIAYLLALGAIAGSVAILVTARQKHRDVWLETSSVVQSALILVAGMLFWLLRPSGGGGDFGYNPI